MTTTQKINAELYAAHAGMLEPLLDESKALRHEELDWVKWFAEAVPSDISEESRNQLFQLVFRDIHKAQEEVQSRIRSFDNEKMASLQRKNVELTKELKNTRAKVQELSNKLISIKKLVEDAEKYSVWGITGMVPILQKFAEWFDGDANRIIQNGIKVSHQANRIDASCNTIQNERNKFLPDMRVIRAHLDSIRNNDVDSEKKLLQEMRKDAGEVKTKADEMDKLKNALGDILESVKSQAMQ